MNPINYPRDKSALVLVDVLNDFLAEDGKLHEQIKPMVDKMDLKANLERLLAGTRSAGIPVVYAPHGLDASTFTDFPYVLPRMQWGKANQVFWKGSKGADFYDPLRPLEGEFIAQRHHLYNAFINTDLDVHLRSKGIEKLVFAGLTSQTCVEGTGRYALEAGYHVTFLTDGVAEFTEKAQEAAIEISYPAFGHEVLTISAFLEALEQ
ncbi:isochorismatase family cysteine hydrolase [Filimonas lacunae]|nr:isochorismatase family cysteine hydrolase [Filimonas lacunae]